MLHHWARSSLARSKCRVNYRLCYKRNPKKLNRKKAIRLPCSIQELGMSVQSKGSLSDNPQMSENGEVYARKDAVALFMHHFSD